MAVESVNGKTGVVKLPGLTEPEGELPSSVVSDSRGGAAGDLLVFNGSSFARLARGESGEQMVVRSDGTVHWEPAPSISGDAWLQAAGNPTNSTKVLQEAAEFLSSQGGGTVRLSDKEYLVDGLVWPTGVKWEGTSHKTNGTVFKAAEGSSNQGIVTISTGVTKGGWKNICFKAAGNAEQDIFYLHSESGGGVGNCVFENLEIGTTGFPAQRNCMWFRGGATAVGTEHQFNAFRNVAMYRANTGAQAATSRCLKATGQCEKFQFDAACTMNGAVPSEHVGTNIELSREFLLATTVSTEAAAGASVITLASVTGLEAKKIFSVGEGAFKDICEVLSITGKEVTLKSPLAFTHATGTNVYTLSGTVGAPATSAPKEFFWTGGAMQNADLQILCDACQIIEATGTDFENQSRICRVMGQSPSYRVNLNDIHLNGSSEGVLNGTGVATVGSNVITGTTQSWAEGNQISGSGIPHGATVTKVEESTITLSTAVTANGTTGATSIPLTKGGKGEGYVTKYEGESTGETTYFISGSEDDQGVVSAGGGRAGVIARTRILPVRTSVGITLALPATASLTINTARSVVLTNAANTVKTLLGLHGTGETVILRATTAKTKLEEGGNLYIPAGSLTLEAGDVATFQRTDYGPGTWVLVDVQRAKEPSAYTIVPQSGGLFAPGIVAPYLPSLVSSAGKVSAAGTIFACRVIVPQTGKLHDLAVFHAVSSGNHRVAVYDTGDKNAGFRTLLWESGSIAMNGEANKWQVLKEESTGLLLEAGQELDFAVMVDNTTATIGRSAIVAGSAASLPTNFWKVTGGANPKLAWSYAAGAYAAFPEKISEANCGTGEALFICIAGRME